MKEIILTNNCIAVVDDEDFELLNKHSWYSQYGKNTIYAARSMRVNKEHITVQMHRVILGLKKGDGLFVDHINHNGLDNRKCNLRICSKKENNRNVKKRRGCVSKYKGVYLHKKIGDTSDCCIWRARIRVDSKFIHLGLFTQEVDAAIAYNAAALNHFGKFAYLNEVNG